MFRADDSTAVNEKNESQSICVGSVNEFILLAFKASVIETSSIGIELMYLFLAEKYPERLLTR